jgi:WD40 repeat protein
MPVPRLLPGGFILDGAFSPDGRQTGLLVSPRSMKPPGVDSVARTVGLMGAPLGEGLFLAASELIPNVQYAATLDGSSRPGQLQLWDWQNGKQLFAPLALPSEPRCLDYSSDGKTLAVICSGGQLFLVDPDSGRVQRQWQARPNSPWNRWYKNNGMVRISPDSRSVLVFSTENVVRVFDLATGRPRYAPLQHQDQCNDIRFSPDGRLVSTASYDNTVRVWDLETGQPVSAPLRHPDWVFNAPFSPDGRYLLTAGRDGTARLWDWQSGREVWAFPHGHEMHAVAFTPDGRWILTASDDMALRVWESVTGKPVTPPLMAGGMGLTIEVTPDGRHAVVGGFISPVSKLKGTNYWLNVFDLGDLAGDNTLDADDLVAWGELLSGQRVNKGAVVTNLSTEEWLQAWRVFRQRHPSYHRMDMDR